MRSRSSSPDGGERKKLKSQRPSAHSFLRFQNCTNRFVDLVWLNYEGQGVKYSTVGPRQFIDVNTYVGHPWVFRDSKTGESLQAEGKEAYEPESWKQHRVNGQPHRKEVLISIPVFTLTERCLQEVKKLVKRCDIPTLEIPETLITKLMSLEPERSYLKPP